MAILYKCPKCGSEDLRVTALLTIRLVQEYDEPYLELDDFDQINYSYWDEESEMACSNTEKDCDFFGEAKEFLIEDTKE